MISTIKNRVFQDAKNVVGWKTRRKLIVFAADDYGNVRLASRQARANLDQAGLKVHSRFDAFDSLETAADLEMLFETLCSVKDKNGQHAVFTPYALPCNIDFEKIEAHHHEEYFYETLPVTFSKLTEHTGAWELWQEGIRKGIFLPQFHGREHVNLKVFDEKLKNADPELLAVLQNRSYTSLSSSGYDTIAWPAAFDFWDFEENKTFNEIIVSGLAHFKEVFGYAASAFTPPVYNCHPVNYEILYKEGICTIDTALYHREHQGRGIYKKRFHYTGQLHNSGINYVVRNVVFEPTDNRGVDWVALALQQIEAAFRWRKPAIISTHRVNFCGHIDPANREMGLKSLKELLKKIIKKWPDAEFVGAGKLGSLINSKAMLEGV